MKCKCFSRIHGLDERTEEMGRGLGIDVIDVSIYLQYVRTIK